MDQPPPRLPSAVERALLMVAKEALLNTLVHAEASRACVRLRHVTWCSSRSATTASDAPRAAVREHGPDVVLLDLELGDDDEAGLAACRQLTADDRACGCSC